MIPTPAIACPDTTEMFSELSMAQTNRAQSPNVALSSSDGRLTCAFRAAWRESNDTFALDRLADDGCPHHESQ